MEDPSGEVVQTSYVEVSLKNMVKALFRENSNATSEKGMLRWNLHKKIQTHPSCTVILVKKMVKKLQKCLDKLQICQSNMHIIPILHTLYYVVLQSPPVISPRLYKAMYGCLIRLLILPFPHCAVALSTLKNIRTELFTPGSLYYRRVIAEQSLKNDHLKLQERVFLLADPELFSGPLEAAVRSDLEVSSSLRDPLVLKRNMVLRLLQSGLGSYCHSPTLQQALECLGDQTLEDFFQETVLAVEQSVRQGPDNWRDYIDNLQMIYDNILTSSDKSIGHEENKVYPITMPYPEIDFILWNNEEDLWNVLANFTLSSSFDLDEKSRRSSLPSTDTGFKKDLNKYNSDPPQSTQRSNSTLSKRRNAYKNSKSGNQLNLMNDKMESSSNNSSRVQRSHTARIVVMGDDRILGKLASAYRSIRVKESKHMMLTKKINFQFYYIPVTDVAPPVTVQQDPSVQVEDRLSVASYLGKVDSWYDCNINILQTAIPNIGMHMSQTRSSEQNLFFLDTLIYYLRCGTEKVNLPLYKVMMTRCSAEASSVIDEVFVSSLEADVAEFRHLKDKSARGCSRRKKSLDVFGGLMSVNYSQTFVSQREQMKGICPMAYSAVITSEPSATHSEGTLYVRFNSMNSEENTNIFVKTISIKAMENRTLVVCFDKDSRRTYRDIQRIEVSPYMDPGCNIRSRFSMNMSKDLPLSKYVDKILSLPINTFSGVTS